MSPDAGWLSALPRPLLIGDRLNAAGNPRLAARLASGEWDAVGEEARAQAGAGAGALDVNGALAGADERRVLLEMIARVRAASPLPLSVDAADPALLLEACGVAGARVIVNSVTASRDAIERWLPRLAGLGAPVIGLAIDESGVPAAAEGRFRCAARFVEAGVALGIPLADLFVDCVALPGGTDPVGENAPALEAMRLVKERLGAPLVLGVSNVAYSPRGGGAGAGAGPAARNARPANPAARPRGACASFLAAALAAGLDAAIANPLDPEIQRVLRAVRAPASGAPSRSTSPPQGKEIFGCLS
jgi:5-methyltetrahydrofolate--homocysteine methyltransferase